MLTGGAVLAISTGLPWATAHSASDQVTVFGVQTEAVGLHVIGPGLLIALLGFLAIRRGAFRWLKIVTPILCLLTAGWVAALTVALDDISRKVLSDYSGLVSIDRGVGVFGIDTGAAIAVLGSLVLVVAPRTRRQRL